MAKSAVGDRGGAGLDFEKLKSPLVEMPTDLMGDSGGKGGKDSDGEDESEEKETGKGTEESEEATEEESEENKEESEESAEEETAEETDETSEKGDGESETVAGLMKHIGSLEAKVEALSKSGVPANGNGGRSAAPAMSDEQWNALGEKTGMSREALNLMAGTSNGLYSRIMGEIRTMFAPMQRQSMLEGLSREKGFEDAPRYAKHIGGILDKFPVEMQSDPNMLRLAVLSARGAGMGKTVAKVRNETERGRKVVERVGSRTPAGKGGRGEGGENLSKFQDTIRQRFGMSKKEYSQLRTRGK